MLLFPSPGDLPGPGIKPVFPILQADSLPSEPPGKPNLRWERAKCSWKRRTGRERWVLEREGINENAWLLRRQGGWDLQRRWQTDLTWEEGLCHFKSKLRRQCRQAGLVRLGVRCWCHCPHPGLMQDFTVKQLPLQRVIGKQKQSRIYFF